MKLDIEKSKEAERHDVREGKEAEGGGRKRKPRRIEKKQKSKTTPLEC
jgi:hypothetical protein